MRDGAIKKHKAPEGASTLGASGHFYGTPFGAYENSGLGREEGIDELLSYTETNAIQLLLGGGAAKD